MLEAKYPCKKELRGGCLSCQLREIHSQDSVGQQHSDRQVKAPSEGTTYGWTTLREDITSYSSQKHFNSGWSEGRGHCCPDTVEMNYSFFGTKEKSPEKDGT